MPTTSLQKNVLSLSEYLNVCGSLSYLLFCNYFILANGFVLIIHDS